MLALGARLARAGWRPSYFGYFAWAQSHPSIVDRLTTRLELLAAEAPEVGLVGHSLGGLLLRQATARVPALKVRHLIMLGTPNRPPRLASRVGRWTVYRVLTGSVGQFLATPSAFEALPDPGFPCTVIAGDRGRRGRLSVFGDDPNDGFVAVEETRLTAAVPLHVFPVRHTFMMNHKQVQAAVLEALGPAPGAVGGPVEA